MCNCKEVYREATELNYQAIQQQLEECEKCVFKKEDTSPKQHIKTYAKVRHEYVKEHWINYGKRFSF